MKVTRYLPFFAVVLLVSPALLAGGLEKYKKWPSSPQGYFMTKAERAEWTAKVQTDADAEQFIKEFLAKRPAGFADDVKHNAEMADKYLSVAGQAGSLTTRGKIVIVLGPPSNFSITAKQEVRADRSMSVHGYQAAAGGAGSGGGSSPGVDADTMINARNRAEMGGVTGVKFYTFTYTADKLPIKGQKDLAVVVEVDTASDREKIDHKTLVQLETLFEAAAEARLTVPPAK